MTVSYLNQLLSAILIGLVRLYQWTLGLALKAAFGRVCRFYPTCSEYFIQAVQKYGPWHGTIRGVNRILRCHPWHPGGYDPP
ncbi:MAG: membrane protein insertion efficiency factor YidD [Gemmataceae bacterium]